MCPSELNPLRLGEAFFYLEDILNDIEKLSQNPTLSKIQQEVVKTKAAYFHQLKIDLENR
jgi:hypothetical protein